MTFSEIEMNLTELQNITSPSINISTNASAVFGQIIDSANSTTNNLLGILVMIAILIVLYITLADKTQSTDFGYSDARALCIALGISLMIGLTEITAGITNNYISIGTFAVLFMMNYIWILAYENKE